MHKFREKMAPEKPLIWVGASKKDLLALPEAVRSTFGFALNLAQHGEKHGDAKVLRGSGGAAVLEVIENDIGGTYRAVYTVKFEVAVFVLHVFQKKSRRGIETPKDDLDLIRNRLRDATLMARELGDE
jgi:phage-related protein